MEFSFTHTLDDYLEAIRAASRPPREPGNKPRESLWTLILTLVLSVTLLICATVNPKTTPNGEILPSKMSTFLLGLALWVFILGILWSIIVKRIEARYRAPNRLTFLILLLTAICASYLIALDTSPAPSAPASLRDVPLQFAPWLVYAFGFWFALLRTLRLIRRKAWDGMPNMKLPQTVRLSDDLVEFKNENARCEYRWPAFVLFRETENLFILQPSRQSFHMIPKRACRDGGEIEALRKLLESHISNAQPITRGFTVATTPPPLPRMVEPLPPRTMN